MTTNDKPARGAGRIIIPRRKCNRWNARRRQIFLAALGVTANVRKSARKAKMSLAAAYELKKRDPAFARTWREALDVGFCELELSLLRDSIKGTERVETMEVVDDDGQRRIKYVKTVRSRDASPGLRLLNAHREEVMRFRAERDGVDEDSEATEARMRSHMDEVRARLIAQGVIADDGANGAG